MVPMQFISCEGHVMEMYLCEGYDESTLALLTTTEAQIPVCGVDGARRVAAGMRSPNRA